MIKLLILFAVLISISGAVAVSYVVLRQLGQPSKKYKKMVEEKTRDCREMLRTASIEEDVYGQIMSGHIVNHIPECNYCTYVRTGDHKSLTAHRADMRRQIEELP